MSYVVFADMSVDIDPIFAAEHDLKYVPMQYILGGETKVSEAPESDETMHAFYEGMRNGLLTSTSQITPYTYEQVFTPYVAQGLGVLYVSLSSGLSTTYEGALMAKNSILENYPDAKIEVVDSLAATGIQGLVVEQACKNQAAGMSLEENAADCRECAKTVDPWFMVEDLVYLKRGGRISATTAIVGSALNIKPILYVNQEGKLETLAKKRGSKQAMRFLVEQFAANYDPSKYGNKVYICCADCKDTAEELKAMVLAERPDADVCITMLCPVIGAHTGPGMLSLIHHGNAECRK